MGEQCNPNLLHHTNKKEINSEFDLKGKIEVGAGQSGCPLSALIQQPMSSCWKNQAAYPDNSEVMSAFMIHNTIYIVHVTCALWCAFV